MLSSLSSKPISESSDSYPCSSLLKRCSSSASKSSARSMSNIRALVWDRVTEKQKELLAKHHDRFTYWNKNFGISFAAPIRHIVPQGQRWPHVLVVAQKGQVPKTKKEWRDMVELCTSVLSTPPGTAACTCMQIIGDQQEQDRVLIVKALTWSHHPYSLSWTF